MADEIRAYTMTISAGTAIATPQRKDVSFPPRVVDAIEIRVPPGPSGLVGFAIQNSNLTVIPFQSDAFIVTADESIRWDLHGYITSGSWQILGYNTDINDHTLYVRFLLDLPPAPGEAPLPAYHNDASLSGGVLIG